MSYAVYSNNLFIVQNFYNPSAYMSDGSYIGKMAHSKIGLLIWIDFY